MIAEKPQATSQIVFSSRAGTGASKVNSSASGTDMLEERVDSSADCMGVGAQIVRLCVGTGWSR